MRIKNSIVNIKFIQMNAEGFNNSKATESNKKGKKGKNLNKPIHFVDGIILLNRISEKIQ